MNLKEEVLAKEVLMKWEGYLDLVKRAEAFLLEDEVFDSLFIEGQFVYICYLESHGENISHHSHSVPLYYFARTDDEAVNDFFKEKSPHNKIRKEQLELDRQNRQKEVREQAKERFMNLIIDTPHD